MTSSIFPLRLVNATVTRRQKRLIGPIDLEIGAKGFTIVMGPNGAGKTSLLRMMHGMERLSEGTVQWQVPEMEARRQQAYVFQTPITMRRTVLDNIAYPLCVHGAGKQDAREKAHSWLSRVGLEGMETAQAMVLSGGERQKMAVARALIRQPEILFLDEPCANLDGRAIREIEDILHEAHQAGTRIIMATHDMGQARRLASDVLFIYRGALHEAAEAETFFSETKTLEARAFLKGDILE